MRIIEPEEKGIEHYVSVICALPTEYEIPIGYWYRGISAERRAYKIKILLSKPIPWVTENEVKELIKTKFNLSISLDQIVISGL